MRQTRRVAAMRCTGRLRVERVHGSWRGKLPDDEVLRAELSHDGENARVETSSGVFDVRLRDGSVRRVTEFSDHVREVQTSFEDRSRERVADERDYVATTTHEHFFASTHALVERYRIDDETGVRTWLSRRVVALPSGDERVRVGRRWAACFSSCGRFFAFVKPGSRALVVVDLHSNARRTVSLSFSGDRCVHLALDRGAGRAVLSLRRRRRDGAREVLLAAVSLDGARVEWEIASALRPARVRRDPRGGARDVVWCEGSGRLEARSLDDGRLATGFGVECDSVAYDEVGRYALLVRDARRCVVRLDLTTGEVLGHDDTGGEVLALAWERGGRRFAQVHAGRVVRVFDRASGTVSHELELAPDGAHFGAAVAFVPGTDAVACAYALWRDGGYVAVLERFSLSAGASIGRMDLCEGTVTALEYAPDGRVFWIVITHRADRRVWHEARLHCAIDGRELASRGVHIRTRPFVAFAVRDSADGVQLRALFARDDTAPIEALDLSTGDAETVALRDDRWLAPIGFAVSGTHFIGNTSRGELLRAPTSGGPVHVGPATRRRYSDWIAESLYSTGDALLAVAEESGLGFGAHLYELETGRKVGGLVLEGGLDEITTLAIAPDESALLVGTRAGVVLELAIRPAR